MKLRGALLALCTLAGCAALGRHREGTSSSLVEFLYPEGQVPEEPPIAIPELKLPVRVGLAFVPSRFAPGYVAADTLPEALKVNLLEKVKANFKGRPYVGDITVIPEVYLRTGQGGFQTLEEVARLYDVDLMALVSYDQVSSTAESNWSLLYWTIVGAYVIRGDRNDVSTLVDTAVFDVRTHKLLFRAPGTDVRTRAATLVEAPRVQQQTREESFSRAVDQMIGNLDAELQSFRVRIKQDQSVKVSHRASVSGGLSVGALSPSDSLALLLIAAWTQRRRGNIEQKSRGARA